MKFSVMIIVLSVMFVNVNSILNKCEDGFVRDKETNRCVPCNPGSYHDKRFDACVPCGFGEYTHTRASTSCLKCHRRYSETHFLLASTSCDHSPVIKILSDGFKFINDEIRSMGEYVINWLNVK